MSLGAVNNANDTGKSDLTKNDVLVRVIYLQLVEIRIYKNNTVVSRK